jgi:Domain of unknown function (DUF4145)
MEAGLKEEDVPPKQITPALGAESYSCPQCGALAAQHWFKVFPRSFEGKDKPVLFGIEEMIARTNRMSEQSDKSRMASAIERLRENTVTYLFDRHLPDATWEMLNMHMSLCHACEAFAIWIEGRLIWPSNHVCIEPHEDMPIDVKRDFAEAASIVDQSPRGSAALSRLALQKLMVDLGEKGKNINDDIASLVQKGLEIEIQQALDVVRVIGNNAVHPGTIDLKDDSATAQTLLQLINLVVDRRISTQKRISEMFKSLPPESLQQIAKRDAGKL